MLAGFFGRLSIAIEPVLCGIVFAGITGGVFLAPRLSPEHVMPDIIIVAPVFALGVLGCAAWALGVMLAPVRALFHTSTADSNGYIAVLTEDRTIACEWPTLGDVKLPNRTHPALCEFSEYGGVHSVDGRPTGVVPARMPALGVGISSRKGEIT